VVLALAASGGVWVGLHAQGALADLGVTEATASREIVRSLTGGYVNVYPASKAFKAAPATVRASLVKNAIAWAKTYTESAAFKAEYDKQRQADTPAPPTFKGTVDDELADQRAQRKKSLEESKKNIEKMPANMRPQMEATIKQMEAQFARMDTDPQMIALARQGLEMQRANDQKAYEERGRAHEKRFPSDPRVLIARRLQEFLDTSRDMDFNAKLVPAGAKQRFADPRYEEKRAEWKLCYRAGKEAVTAARDAAQTWSAAVATK
jgi:flagellar motility protein MotE (MotC chaperone)